MKNQIERDKKRRNLYKKYELKRLKLKSIIQDLSVSPAIRYNATLKLAKLPRNSSPIRVRNRCVITGRPRGIVTDFKMSRLCFRDNALFGLLSGVKKSSW